jgi:probable HAF family extracellular repeat protein
MSEQPRPGIRLPHSLSIAFIVAASAATAAGQSLTQLGFLGEGGPSIANGISADGRVVVGFSNSPDGYRAFRWTAAGGMQNLGAFVNPGSYTSSEAHAANADGSVVVGTSIRPDSLNENGSPFRWTAAGGLEFLGSMGGTAGGWAYAITPDGSVIAGSMSATIMDYAAFRWLSPGPPAPLAGVPGQVSASAHAIAADGRTFAGSISIGSLVNHHGALWGDGGFTVSVLPDLCSQGISSVLGMTPDGRTQVGQSCAHAVKWTDGGVTSLGTLPNGLPFSIYLATGVSADGNTIVGLGNYDPNSSAGSAFIWDPINGMRDLNTVAIAAGINLNGFYMYYARGVSADGKCIVGYGFSQTNQEAFLLDLRTGVVCYPNCDMSTAAPTLNVQDFTCFLQRYAAGESYANCDNSTQAPTLNVQDFTCFLQRYAAGCP